MGDKVWVRGRSGEHAVISVTPHYVEVESSRDHGWSHVQESDLMTEEEMIKEAREELKKLERDI